MEVCFPKPRGPLLGAFFFITEPAVSLYLTSVVSLTSAFCSLFDRNKKAASISEAAFLNIRKTGF